MILLDILAKRVFQKRQTVDPLATLLLNWDSKFNTLLSDMKENKSYSRLQLLEETLRKALLKTLDTKGEVAISLMKKDFEMNKELLAKIQEQNLPQSDQKQNPRFGLN